MYTIRMPPSLETQLENIALQRRTHQSTIVREALEIYFRDHCDSEIEQRAAEIMTRRREELLKLEGPKDKYDSLLFPVRVRKFVNEMRGEWKNAGYPMSARLLDELIAFVHEEKEVMVVGTLTPDPETGGPRVWTRRDGSYGASYELRASTVKFLGGGNGAGQKPASSDEHADADEIPF